MKSFLEFIAEGMPVGIKHDDLVDIYKMRKAGINQVDVAHKSGYDLKTIKTWADHPDNVNKYTESGHYHPPHVGKPPIRKSRVGMNDDIIKKAYSLRKYGLTDNNIAKRLLDVVLHET